MRTHARIVVFNLIYMSLFEDVNDESTFIYLAEQERLDESAMDFAKNLFEMYSTNSNSIQKIVDESISGYKMERVYKTDLSLLLLAVTEMKFIKTPKAVVIDEVLKISKQYSTEKSTSFINGVLAKIEI